MLDRDQAIIEHHSTRMFLPRPMPRELVDVALALAQHALSNSNIRPWRLVFVSGTARNRLNDALFKAAGHDTPRIPALPKAFEHRRFCRPTRVIALGVCDWHASAHNLQFARGLGADQVIDRRVERFEDVLGPVDVVFDTIGGETLARSWGVLKPDGSRSAASAEQTREQRVLEAFFIVEPNQAQVEKLASLIDGGEMRLQIRRGRIRV